MPPPGHIHGAKITHNRDRTNNSSSLRNRAQLPGEGLMKMNKRFIASIIRSARSETVTLPWAAKRRRACQTAAPAPKRKLG